MTTSVDRDRRSAAVLVGAALDEIGERYTDPALSTRDIAFALGTSSLALSAAFRLRLRESVRVAMRERRVQKAQEILARAHTSGPPDLGAIADSVGFRTSARMDRAMRATTRESGYEFWLRKSVTRPPRPTPDLTEK